MTDVSDCLGSYEEAARITFLPTWRTVKVQVQHMPLPYGPISPEQRVKGKDMI